MPGFKIAPSAYLSTLDFEASLALDAFIPLRMATGQRNSIKYTFSEPCIAFLSCSILILEDETVA